MLLALFLSLSLPALAARHKHGSFQVDMAKPIVRVPAEQLQAYGGEVDCVVRLKQRADHAPARPVIKQCPGRLAGPVLEAAQKWQISVSRGTVTVLGIIMVRPLPERREPKQKKQDEDAMRDVPWRQVTPTVRVNPGYPPAAKVLAYTLGDGHLAVTCLVRIYVNEVGLPYANNLQYCPAIFRVVADHAARQWRFTPFQEDGVPVKSTFMLTLNFILE